MNEVKSFCKKNIFVGGSTQLEAERTHISSAIRIINDDNFREDFPPEVPYTYLLYNSYETLGNVQIDYNEFISNETNYFVFIFDSTFGSKTKEELSIAKEKFINNRESCKLYVFVKENDDKTILGKVRRFLGKNTIYISPYTDPLDLKSQILKILKAYTKGILSNQIAQALNNKNLYNDPIGVETLLQHHNIQAS